MNIIENWADVSGTVESIAAHPEMQGFQQISLKLKDSKDVAEYPNLAKADEGKSVLINVRDEELEKSGAAPGKHFKGSVRKAFGQVYFLK